MGGRAKEKQPWNESVIQMAKALDLDSQEAIDAFWQYAYRDVVASPEWYVDDALNWIAREGKLESAFLEEFFEQYEEGED